MRAIHFLPFLLLFAALLLPTALTFEDSSENDFQNGTFNATRWNTTGYIELDKTGSDYHQNGTFLSRIIGDGYYRIWTSLLWHANNTQGNVTFQATASNSSNTTYFSGPGSQESHYTASGMQLNLSASRHFRYLAYLNTTNSSVSPMLFNVTIASDPVPPLIIRITQNTIYNESSLITLEYNISSMNRIENCSIIINGTVAGQNITPIENGTVNSFLLTLTNAHYSWNVSCTDEAGTTASSDTGHFNVTIPDTTPPLISFHPASTTGWKAGNSARIVISSSDDTNHSVFVDWDSTLSLWLSFESENGSHVPDDSPNGINASLINISSAPLIHGRYGNALYLEERGSRLTIPNDGSFDASPNRSLSYTLWLKTENSSFDKQLLSTIDSCTGWSLHLAPDGTLIQTIAAGTGCLSHQNYTINATGTADGRWHHIAGVFDREQGMMSLIINGHLHSNLTIDDEMPSAAGDLIIGSHDSSINTSLDELRIFARSLSIPDINSSIDGTRYVYDHEFTSLQDGNYSALAYAIDGSGNINKTDELILHIDNVSPPSPDPSYPEDGHITNSASIAFNCSAVNTNFNTVLKNITFIWNLSGTPNGTAEVTGEMNSSSFLRAGIPEGTHSWACQACDNSSNCALSGTKTFTIDTTSPVISGIQNLSTTNVSSIISWLTDEPANSTVHWGINGSISCGKNSSATLTITHELLTSGLINSTIYYYNLTSCDASGNCNTTGPRNFTSGNNPPPDTTPPSLSDLDATVSTGDANISWTTDEPANYSFSYGDTTALLTGTITSQAFLTNHSAELHGLTNRTTYHYNITACDSLGNCNTTGPLNLTTMTAADTTPPTLTMNHPPDGILEHANHVIFNCTASDYNLSTVSLYGDFTGTWSYNSSNSSGLPGDYSFSITLLNGTYLWACHACDAEGNCIFSGNRTIGIGRASLELVSTTPTNGTNNATTDSPINLIFNKALDSATITGSVALSSQLGPVSHSFSYNNLSYTLAISPNLPLLYSTNYTILLRETLADHNDNRLSETTIHFQTSHRDSDSDGIPDHLDPDADGDGIDDSIDPIIGNSSHIRSNSAVSVIVNGTDDLSIPYNSSYTVKIIHSSLAVVEFDHDFSSGKLDLRNITIVADQDNTTGSTLVTGLPQGTQKIIRIADLDGNPSDACLKDDHIEDVSEITDNCNGHSEIFLRCDGRTTGSYSCITGPGYIEVRGATHTGAKEICHERWVCNSWIPMYCYLGMSQRRQCTDQNSCGTTRFKPTTTQHCDNPLFPTGGCRAEWECYDWGECANGIRARECVNVGTCPDHVRTPIREELCEIEETPNTPNPEEIIKEDEPQEETKETPSTPTTGISDQTPSSPIEPQEEHPRESTEEYPPYLFWIIVFINLAIIGAFILYKFHPSLPTGRKHPIKSYYFKKKEAASGKKRFSWLLFRKNVRRARDIAWLKKIKKFRDQEFEEIRRIAQETKDLGLDTIRHRFMSNQPLITPALSPPKKPDIHHIGIMDKMLFKIFKVDIREDRKATEGTDDSDSPIKKELAELKIRMNHAEKGKDTFEKIYQDLAKVDFTERTGRIITDDIKGFTLRSQQRMEALGKGSPEQSTLIDNFFRRSRGSWSGKEFRDLMNTLRKQGYHVHEDDVEAILERKKAETKQK